MTNWYVSLIYMYTLDMHSGYCYSISKETEWLVCLLDTEIYTSSSKPRTETEGGQLRKIILDQKKKKKKHKKQNKTKKHCGYRILGHSSLFDLLTISKLSRASFGELSIGRYSLDSLFPASASLN